MMIISSFAWIEQYDQADKHPSPATTLIYSQIPLSGP